MGKLNTSSCTATTKRRIVYVPLGGVFSERELVYLTYLVVDGFISAFALLRRDGRSTLVSHLRCGCRLAIQYWVLEVGGTSMSFHVVACQP